MEGDTQSSDSSNDGNGGNDRKRLRDDGRSSSSSSSSNENENEFGHEGDDDTGAAGDDGRRRTRTKRSLVTVTGQCRHAGTGYGHSFLTCKVCDVAKNPCTIEECPCKGHGFLIPTTQKHTSRHEIPGHGESVSVRTNRPKEVGERVMRLVRRLGLPVHVNPNTPPTSPISTTSDSFFRDVDGDAIGFVLNIAREQYDVPDGEVMGVVDDKCYANPTPSSASIPAPDSLVSVPAAEEASKADSTRAALHEDDIASPLPGLDASADEVAQANVQNAIANDLRMIV